MASSPLAEHDTNIASTSASTAASSSSSSSPSASSSDGPPPYVSTPAMQDYSKDKQQREDLYRKQATDELIDLCLLGFSIVCPIVYVYIVMMASQSKRTATALTIFGLMLFNMACNVALSKTKQHSLSNPLRARLTVFRFAVNDIVGSSMVWYDRDNIDNAWHLFCFFNIVGGSLDFSTAHGAIINDIIHVAVGSWWCWLSGRSLASVTNTTVTLSLVAAFFSGAAVTLRTSRVEMHTSVDRKKLYLAHIAHELRTPLTGILGISSMLKEELTSQSQSTSIVPSSASVSPSPLSQIASLSSGTANGSPFFVPRRQHPIPLAATMGTMAQSLSQPLTTTPPTTTAAVTTGTPSGISLTVPLLPLSLNATFGITADALQRNQSFSGMSASTSASSATSMTERTSQFPLPPNSSSLSISPSVPSNNNGEMIAMVNTLSICTDSLLQVANAVLDISKIEANALILRRDPLDLRLVVEEVTELARASAIQLKKDVRIVCDVTALTCPSLLPGGGRLTPPISPTPSPAPSPILPSRPLAMPSAVSSLRSSILGRITSSSSSSNDNSGTLLLPSSSPSPSSNLTSPSPASLSPSPSPSSPNDDKRCCVYADAAGGRCCSGAHVLSDGQRIRQLLINLMNNAVKFTHEGSVTLTVHRVSQRSPKNVKEGSCKYVFQVIDTGSGVPDHLRESIFEPFMQGPQGASGQAGTGLGLYISRRLSETFGGTVYCKANTNAAHGSIFCLELNLTLRTDCTAATSYHCQPWTSSSTMFANMSPTSLIARTLSPTFAFPSGASGSANTSSNIVGAPIVTAANNTNNANATGNFPSSSYDYSVSNSHNGRNGTLTPPIPASSNPSPALGALPSHPSPMMPYVSLHLLRSVTAGSSASDDNKRSSGASSPSSSVMMEESDHAASSPLLRPQSSHGRVTSSNSSRDDGMILARSNSRVGRRIKLATVHGGSVDRLNRLQSMDSLTTAAPSVHGSNASDSQHADSSTDAATTDDHDCDISEMSDTNDYDTTNGNGGQIRRRPLRFGDTAVHGTNTNSSDSSLTSTSSSNATAALVASSASTSHALMRAAALRRFRQQQHTNGNLNKNDNHHIIASVANNHHQDINVDTYRHNRSHDTSPKERSPSPTRGASGSLSSNSSAPASQSSIDNNSDHDHLHHRRSVDITSPLTGNSSGTSSESPQSSPSSSPTSFTHSPSHNTKPNGSGSGDSGGERPSFFAWPAPSTAATIYPRSTSTSTLLSDNSTVASMTGSSSSSLSSGISSSSTTSRSCISPFSLSPLTPLSPCSPETVSSSTSTSAPPSASSSFLTIPPPAGAPSTIGAPNSDNTSVTSRRSPSPVSMASASTPAIAVSTVASPIRVSTVAGLANAAVSAAASGTHHRVLLVEDVDINRAVLARMLQKLGLPADQAVNGREAVELAMNRKYDFILMDCQMPVMDGYSATECIRKKAGPNQHSRIIALTASALPGDRERCLRAGMNEYVTKPVSFATLKTLLDH